MFEDYTIEQLLELRDLFAKTTEPDDEPEKQADTFLVLQCIDEELSTRERKISA